MKNLFLTAILLVSGTAVFAQSPINKGQSQFNAGLGISSIGIPIYVGLDYGVHNDITLGGELSFRSYNDKWGGSNYSHSIIGISGNGNYHFNRVLQIPQKWDLYAGLNIGFYIWNSPSAYGGTRSSGLGLGAQLGGRYYFTDKVGVNLEFGGGNVFSSGKFGISVKL